MTHGDSPVSRNPYHVPPNFQITFETTLYTNSIHFSQRLKCCFAGGPKRISAVSSNSCMACARRGLSTWAIKATKVTPEVELMLFVFSLMHCVRCLEVDVFQIELVHSVFRFNGWRRSLDLLCQPLLLNSLKKSVTLFNPFLLSA